ATYARAIPWTGTPDRMRALSTEAVTMARTLGDPASLAKALSAEFLAQLGPSPQEAATVCEELVTVAETTGDTAAIAEAHVYRVAILFELCDMAGVARELEALRHL